MACSIQDAAIWLVEVPLAANSRKGELLEPILTYHQRGLVAFVWGQFPKKCSIYVGNCWSKFTAATPRDQWVKSPRVFWPNSFNMMEIFFKFAGKTLKLLTSNFTINMWVFFSSLVGNLGSRSCTHRSSRYLPCPHDTVRATYLITTKIGGPTPLVLLLNWLNFGGILLEICFAIYFFKHFSC